MTQLNEGWSLPGTKKKSHYVIWGHTLCGRDPGLMIHIRSTPYPGIERTCKTCLKMRRKFITKGWVMTNLITQRVQMSYSTHQKIVTAQKEVGLGRFDQALGYLLQALTDETAPEYLADAMRRGMMMKGEER